MVFLWFTPIMFETTNQIAMYILPSDCTIASPGQGPGEDTATHHGGAERCLGGRATQRDAWRMAVVSIGKPWENHGKMVISPRKMEISMEFILQNLVNCWVDSGKMTN